MQLYDFKIVRDDYNVDCWCIQFKSNAFTKLRYKFGDNIIIEAKKPISKGTEEQNRAMHGLLTAYYKTGMHSCPQPCTLADFKVHIKSIYGPQIIQKVGGRECLIIKSWANYTKQERINLIDGLIAEIKQSGAVAESYELQEILKGMELGK
jgi:hypothetical protein